MKRAGAGLLFGVLVLSLVCTAYGMVISRGVLEGSIRAEIQAATPDLFTVLALPPGYNEIGPQGLTAAQMIELATRLTGVAELASVSEVGTSSSLSLKQTDGTVQLLKPAVPYLAVSAEYFGFMGFVPVEGRLFTTAEEQAATQVCVVGTARPEGLGTIHSDPEGDMSKEYEVIGRLPPVEGDLFPLPRIWRRLFWRPLTHDMTKRTYVGNLLVYHS